MLYIFQLRTKKFVLVATEKKHSAISQHFYYQMQHIRLSASDNFVLKTD